MPSRVVITTLGLHVAAVVFLTIFVLVLFLILSTSDGAVEPKPNFQHPIPKLMDEARTKHEGLMARQSGSLYAAVKTYRTRYSRAPPKGFDDWWRFALRNNVKIVDEYDFMMADLEPFWSLSGEELRKRATEARSLPSIALVRIVNGSAFVATMDNTDAKSEMVARAAGLVAILEKFSWKLPDLDFPVNAKAEGRLLIPWERIQYPNITLQDSPESMNRAVDDLSDDDWGDEGNVWEAYRRTCAPGTSVRRLFKSIRGPSHSFQKPIEYLPASIPKYRDDFEFSNSLDHDFRFCNHPWARYQQGHFFSDSRTISTLYPIFSPAKAPGYSDILIPSHEYHVPSKRYIYGFDPVEQTIKDTDELEVPWKDKRDNIFWRGPSTDGGSSPAGFMGQYQRHRFIRMASDNTSTERTVVFPDPTSSNNFLHAGIPISSLNAEIVDTAFTKSVGCIDYPGGCDQMHQDHRFADAVQLGDHWQYKALLDLDGSGHSPMFPAFLASESSVIKATVYREFFSDWIQPWLHYIPLSSSYKEVYNIHAYFFGPSGSMRRMANNATVLPSHPKARRYDGGARLRQIAKAGRQWKSTIMRNVDMEAYVYRLCLEYARLSADDREAMAYRYGVR